MLGAGFKQETIHEDRFQADRKLPEWDGFGADRVLRYERWNMQWTEWKGRRGKGVLWCGQCQKYGGRRRKGVLWCGQCQKYGGIEDKDSGEFLFGCQINAIILYYRSMWLIRSACFFLLRGLTFLLWTCFKIPWRVFSTTGRFFIYFRRVFKLRSSGHVFSTSMRIFDTKLLSVTPFVSYLCSM